ncbi:hypothetical protein D3C75_1095580 [compost metagenome]
MKEVRFKQDGKSVDRIQYRMGYLLYVHLLNKQKDEEQGLTVFLEDSGVLVL